MTIMRKIKNAFYGASSAVLFAPVMAQAQFKRPEDTNLPDGTLTDVVTSLMKWLLALVGVIAVIGFAIAGILYLTAAGDEDRIESAKRAMIFSIIGVIVALIGLVIIGAVDTWLQGDSSEF